MKLLAVLCFLLLLIFSNVIFANNSSLILSKIQKRLSHPENISGQFRQKRKMPILSMPLISSGKFKKKKKNGLKWYQTKPFKSTLIVTSSKIEQKMENAPLDIITKSKEPIVFSFVNVFLSVFNGNTKEIRKYFNISLSNNSLGPKWEILLKPKSSPLNKAIVSIKLSGEKYVNLVKINEKKGNSLIIRFFDIKELKS